jgi:hypothetical protein
MDFSSTKTQKIENSFRATAHHLLKSRFSEKNEKNYFTLNFSKNKKNSRFFSVVARPP